jgi:tetratricopeptide (TPR) repeat protein
MYVLARSDTLMVEGERLAAAGRVGEAARKFEEAHKELPGDARVFLRLAAATSPSDPRAALRAARRATEISPNSAAAHALLARYALLAEEPDEALKAARRTLELAPDNAMAPTLLHLAKGMKGRYGEALAGLVTDGIFEQTDTTALAMELFLRRWREEGPAYAPLPEDLEVPAPGDPVDPEDHGHAGPASKHLHEAYDQGDAIGMLEALPDLRTEEPDHPDVAAGYAAALHQCGRNDLAEPWVRRALEEQRASAAEEFEQATGRALARFGRAITRRPEPKRPADGFDAEPEGLILAGWIYLSLGELKPARKLAERGSKTVNPFDRWEARLVLASVHLEAGQRQAALAELRDAVDEEPLVLYLWLHRAALLPAMKAMGRAITAARKEGDRNIELALRGEMGRIATDPGRLKGSRRLAAALEQTEIDLPQDDVHWIRGYAERGLGVAAKE